jgi:hypothetical protein
VQGLKPGAFQALRVRLDFNLYCSPTWERLPEMVVEKVRPAGSRKAPESEGKPVVQKLSESNDGTLNLWNLRSKTPSTSTATS